MTNLLRERGIRVTAFDYDNSISADGVYRRDHYPEIEMHLTSDPVALPFGDRSFDAVLSCGVLEHVAHPDASLDEIRRVLSPAGRLYVYKLANRHSWTRQVARAIGTYYHGAYPNDRLYTKRTARQLMTRHGFRIQELRRANILPLNLIGPVFDALTPALWALNRLLARIPVLNLVATDLELLASPASPE
jgi:ubiquinone/menaquinone biosynthesis C-methylase UbiE